MEWIKDVGGIIVATITGGGGLIALVLRYLPVKIGKIFKNPNNAKSAFTKLKELLVLIKVAKSKNSDDGKDISQDEMKKILAKGVDVYEAIKPLIK
jgi:hypothetical protein